MPELPEVEVVRRGLQRWASGRRIAAVEVLHPRAVRRHVAGERDFAARLVGRVLGPALRRGKYLWLPLLDEPAQDAVPGVPAPSAPPVPSAQSAPLGRGGEPPDVPEFPCLVAHLGMSGQLLVQPPEAPDETHLRVRLSFDDGGREVRFVDQRTFGGLAVEPGVPAELPAGARQSRAAGAAAPNAAAPTAVARTVVAVPGTAVPEHPARLMVPRSVAHIARDPMDELFDDAAFHRALRARRTGLKRALLDQTLISGVGNIYADEALWRARLHYERPTATMTRPLTERLLAAVRAVMEAALEAGGTSFDSLYVNVNGESGYFARSLDAYGRAGLPCGRCGRAIVRESFMNRSSYYCPRCQRRG
ncbi:Fpg/Nei family DNA glycosylase [Allostreptomyces psammosilenae]|uniref:Formamidopyrimidine-DNA glycosylase n=1 Tax=Allostreptomyces psammosilenae TaxID=1892865 RepID=A0A852ZW42_9ACTN|nr:Fpg/Nei family DNA glycosylase [Allostreptomyces psammosilenae]NYI06596.1 formamidopyrimidine-DNA glycosylase [Allostreptomyces psammosilenae]